MMQFLGGLKLGGGLKRSDVNSMDTIEIMKLVTLIFFYVSSLE